MSNQQSFSCIGTGLPRLNHYLARIIASCSRTQHSDVSKAGTRGLESSTLPLSHWAPSMDECPQALITNYSTDFGNVFRIFLWWFLFIKQIKLPANISVLQYLSLQQVQKITNSLYICAVSSELSYTLPIDAQPACTSVQSVRAFTASIHKI